MKLVAESAVHTDLTSCRVSLYTDGLFCVKDLLTLQIMHRPSQELILIDSIVSQTINLKLW